MICAPSKAMVRFQTIPISPIEEMRSAEDIGLRSRRKNHEFAQESLAQSLGVSLATVKASESGRRAIPAMLELALAGLLGRRRMDSAGIGRPFCAEEGVAGERLEHRAGADSVDVRSWDSGQKSRKDPPGSIEIASFLKFADSLRQNCPSGAAPRASRVGFGRALSEPEAEDAQ